MMAIKKLFLRAVSKLTSQYSPVHLKGNGKGKGKGKEKRKGKGKEKKKEKKKKKN